MAREHDFYIRFTLSEFLRDSALPEEPQDFINEFHFTINLFNESGEDVGLAGRGVMSQILFGLAVDNHFALSHVMDASQSILDMSEMLFEWEEDKEFYSKIEDYFTDIPLMNSNICYLENLEILPRYRGLGLGKKVIMNLAQRFYDSCGLWIIRAFPLQHNLNEPDFANRKWNDWEKMMGYPNFEPDFEKSQYKLFHYYQQMGLKNPFDEEYFIATPYQLLRKDSGSALAFHDK
ncbi:MAG: hypothetical protein WD555_01590 [Fulvivirga sp.]